MYQKFKYILVATIILIIVIVIITMDAGSRYNSKNKNTSQQQSKTLTAEQIQALQQTNEAMFGTNNTSKTSPSPEEQAELDKAKSMMQPKEIRQETDEEMMRRQFDEKKALLPTRRTGVREQQAEDLPEIESLSTDTNASVTMPANGYIADTTGKKLPDYTLQTTFSAGSDQYAVVIQNSQYSTGSKYTPRKFYIYKNVDDKYYRSNYLFEHSEVLTEDGKSPNLTVKLEGNNVVIEYSAGTKIIRKFNTTFLKNNYKQYLSTPQIKYVEEEEQEND